VPRLGYLSLVLHAHLPFVRHPEHAKFLEETWLFEAITETYVPLLQVLERWRSDGLRARLTLTLSPTLCAMLRDPLLRSRYAAHLENLIELAAREVHRTAWQPEFHSIAQFYHARFSAVRDFYRACRGDLLGRFRALLEAGQIEVITSAATHALLPFLANHLPSLRGQILVACDYYRTCFGRNPVGFWLPECAYSEAVEPVLKEAGLLWFITDTHGVLHARPQPQYGMYAPLLTPKGLAAFGRDPVCAKQVWSRQEGYPGDPRYRDFYRDIGFDLDLDYLRTCLAAPDQRSFTGIKYFRITGNSPDKAVYDRQAAVHAAEAHAAHFLGARMAQIQQLASILNRPPVVVAPYDAELFGHWWYEGPEFLDQFVRHLCHDQSTLELITPEDYLRQQPTNQVATPAPSSWGEEGYWRVWLNEENQWIYPHLQVAQERMSELARRFCHPRARDAVPTPASPSPDDVQLRALKQAARELLLAQASDWPFILRTGTSPGYARQRVTDHLLSFTRLYEQLTLSQVAEPWLAELEARDNLFPEIDCGYWA
jgi:1,4-alpha-glucan branching enzyme